MAQSNWHPTWYKPEHASAWDRVKEAFRRDWQQTKHDLHAGGHELNQSVADTVKQAQGKEAIPVIDKANPPKVIGDADWDQVDVPANYGYAARTQYGQQHTAWTTELESTLKTEWEKGDRDVKSGWENVRDHVRRGYEYNH
jgi:hypothetical protein